MSYSHVSELFVDGSRPKIAKSHCFLCHRELTRHRHAVWGNGCRECNGRASMTGRGIITQEESDRMLLLSKREPSVETWRIDGVEYVKYPDGRLTRPDHD